MSRDYQIKDKFAFVMGGGKFGTEALKYFKANGAKVLVVDLNPICRARMDVDISTATVDIRDSLKNGQAAFLVGDAVEHLMDIIEVDVPDWVVTAIPSNAVAKVVATWLSKAGYKLEPYQDCIEQVLKNIPESLVSFVNKESAVIVVSYMPPHMQCIENCMPPKDFCASTSRPKLTTMDKLLDFSVYGLTDLSGILKSEQLTGGLGAIRGNQLFSLLTKLEKHQKESFTLAVGTACDCHGIINIFKITKS
ncbi:MAG: hypothetical protein JW815_00720 [Candidatus Bathyarchaeota archaeon]|nr:hypothetical protein [Candidatus Bathyarchaeum sp.]